MLHFVYLLLLVSITLADDVTRIRQRFQGFFDGDKILVKLRFFTDSPADVIIFQDSGYNLEDRSSRLRVHVSRNFYRVYDFQNETELNVKHTQVIDTDVALTLANGTVSVKINDENVVQLPTGIFKDGWLDGDKISVKLRFSTDSPADVIIYEDTGDTLENRTSRLRVHVSRNFYRVYDYKNETELDMKHTQKVNDTDVALTLANGTVSVKINDGTIAQLPTPIFETGLLFHGALAVNYNDATTSLLSVDIDESDRNSSYIPIPLHFTEGQCLTVNFAISTGFFALLDRFDQVPLLVNIWDTNFKVARRMVAQSTLYDIGLSGDCKNILIEYQKEGTLISICDNNITIPHPEQGPPDYYRLSIPQNYMHNYMGYSVSNGSSFTTPSTSSPSSTSSPPSTSSPSSTSSS